MSLELQIEELTGAVNLLNKTIAGVIVEIRNMQQPVAIQGAEVKAPEEKTEEEPAPKARKTRAKAKPAPKPEPEPEAEDEDDDDDLDLGGDDDVEELRAKVRDLAKEKIASGLKRKDIKERIDENNAASIDKLDASGCHDMISWLESYENG